MRGMEIQAAPTEALHTRLTKLAQGASSEWGDHKDSTGVRGNRREAYAIVDELLYRSHQDVMAQAVR
jgi:hypothetical protein